MTELRKARLMHSSQKKSTQRKMFSWGSKSLKYSVLILWLLISIFPFIWALMASLTEPSQIPSMGINPFHSGLTTSNYHYLFSDTSLKRSIGLWIRNGAIFATVGATLNVFFNFLAGYGLSRIAFKGKDAILWYFVVGMMIPGQITQIPQLFILIKLGFISPGGSNFLWFVGLIFTGMTSASWIFFVRQQYINMGTSAEEAGAMDGLSTFGVFIRISLKVMVPLMATQWAMIFMAVWNNFITFVLFSGGDADRLTLVSALNVVSNTASISDPNLGSAVTLAATNIACIPVIVVYFGSLYFQKKGVAVSDK